MVRSTNTLENVLIENTLENTALARFAYMNKDKNPALALRASEIFYRNRGVSDDNGPIHSTLGNATVGVNGGGSLSDGNLISALKGFSDIYEDILVESKLSEIVKASGIFEDENSGLDELKASLREGLNGYEGVTYKELVKKINSETASNEDQRMMTTLKMLDAYQFNGEIYGQLAREQAESTQKHVATQIGSMYGLGNGNGRAA